MRLRLPMCQYEKETLDTVIVEHAKESQTVMFGEIHDTVLSGSPPPIEDSRYVISLLPLLKQAGYTYLALEVKENARVQGHSRDILRCYRDCMKEKEIQEENYPHAKPGWIELVKTAVKLGYRIKFIDVPLGGIRGVSSRDLAMFKKLESDIFARDEKGKIVLYVGANHVIEQETYEALYLHRGKERPLGLLLNEYTKGKNYSVYMGYPYDTPGKCDLFISYFIWDTFKRVRDTPQGM